MKRPVKRILSLICALCLLSGEWGGFLPQVLTAGAEAAYSATREVSASDGKTYAVTVRCDDDSIPEDAGLRVTELTGADRSGYVTESAALLGAQPEALTLARAFDIALFDRTTGAELEPGGNVKVSIALLDAALDESGDINVVHFGDAPELMESALRGDAVEFETNGFSVYVVIGSDGETVTPQTTFTFWIPNPDIPGIYKEYSFTDTEGHTVYKQIVTSADELIVPQPTSTDTEVFAGWYQGGYGDSGTLVLEDDPFDFDNYTITENSAIDLYAAYRDYAVVIFHDQYDSSSRTFPIAYTRRAELVPVGEGQTAATIRISDLSTTYTSTGGAKKAFFGWSETPITTPGSATDDEGNPVAVIPTDAEGCITVTGVKHLYPIFKEIHRLTYYAAQSGLSAAYVPPAQFFDGDPVIYYDDLGTAVYSLPVTSRNGYTFLGWWAGTLVTSGDVETVNYGQQITGPDGRLVASADDGGVYISGDKLYLRSDAVLYARWQASYRIVYWKQVTTETPDTVEKHYAFAETVTRTAEIGETVSVAEADRANDRYDGYCYVSCDPASAVIGNTKELTVLNVYYDLSAPHEPSGQLHTLTFVDSVAGESAAEMPPAVTDLPYEAELYPHIPADPTSGQKSNSGKTIFSFDAWYMDPACTVKANLETMTMPDEDLTVYAGWTAIKFRVDIDPNYGALYAEENGAGTGSTYFNNTYVDEPIGEYTHVTRDYVVSSSGVWYYANHDRAYGGDRHTFYTIYPSLATEDTTFEYSPGAYTYVGWYEVYLDANGNEIGEASEPYDFSQHTDHNTKIRLHWKRTGSYYLAYDAGNGTLESGEKTAVLPDRYADYAGVLLTRSANAPAGYTFVGWQVRGSDSGVVYKPGQTFTLRADNAIRVSGKDIVYLDAVYVKIGTATVVYDANAGTVAESNVDFGKIPGDAADQWVAVSGTVDAAAGTAAVSGLTNNSKFKLSSGAGFTAPEGSGAVFQGWSDREICDASAAFYSKDSAVTYGVYGSTTLYAVWGARVTYRLNSETADWGTAWDPEVYTLEDGVYSQTAYLGAAVSEPTNVPVYTGTDEQLFRYWATRTGSGTEGDPYIYTEYDFTQPVTGALDLYAYWKQNTIKVHAVDASAADLADKTDDPEWSVEDLTISAAGTVLSGTSHVTAPADGNYEFAFAAVSVDLASVSESNAVTAVKYEDRKVKVQFKGESSFQVLDDDSELYFVYYQKRALNIGYKSMEASGVLDDVTTNGAEPATTGETLLGTYSLAGSIPAPLNYVTGFTSFAYAIGIPDPGTQMNASNLSLITNTAGAGDAAPTLWIRNTWRGFEYTTSVGEDAVWVSCGYEPQLYVIYYTQQPTVIMFSEKTVGASSVMDTEFTFDLLVTQITTTTESVQTQIYEGGSWVDSGEPSVTTTTSDPETIFDTTAEGNHPYLLKNGEANSSILFHSSTTEIGDPVGDGTTRTVTTTTTVIAQTAVITQTANASFATAINETAQESEPYQYTCTSTDAGGTQNVIFTNTHKALPVEVHVAMVETDGTIQRDGAFRSAAAEDYQFDLALGESKALLTELPAAALFSGNTDTYAFSTVVSGVGSEGSAVTIGNMDIASVSYAQRSGNVYALVLKDSSGNTIAELGDSQLYYLYYPMPRIRYVKETAGGVLTDITGCLEDGLTGQIVPSDSVTYSHEPLTMNGKTVAQNESIEIPLSGFVISQSGNNFRMPPVLDDGLSERYLNYVKLGAGSGGAADSSALDVTESLAVQLKLQNNKLQYKFDGATWEDLPLSGTPTIYAIYSERGYDLQISKTVDMSQSGEDAIFSGSSFTVTISSTAIARSSYDAEGAESATVPAVPSDGTVPGTITLTVADGTKVRIKGLGRGEYTITESGNENYTLTAKTGPIIGNASSTVPVTDNTTVSLTLDSETKVDLTNSPKAICRIGDQYFYTLQSMVAYVDTYIATATATAEILTDYLMPAADAVEIPGGFNITLTTADSLGHVAVITRTAALANVPLFTNNGALTITDLTLEGNSVNATAPMIRSAGDLTIGSGATIQNAAGGGAINATAGDITVSGVIQNCSAAAGGAICHSGNGTIALNGTGTIQNNTAASGSGGAIWLADGMVTVSGTSRIAGNKAESGNGGAIYSSGMIVVEVDQGGSITGNTAREGGAIYADGTAVINISETANVSAKPAVTGNRATAGSGGAIYVNGGSVSVSGGSLSNNKAENGLGGAVYSNSASITISGTTEVKTNTAKEGGALYTVSGPVTISGGAVDNNTASTGSGGAVYAGSGNIAVSGASLSGNRSTAGSGGAIYAGSGNVSVSGGSLSDNTAYTDGGAVFAGSGSITVSVPDGGTASTIRNNKATNGKGGALYASIGAVTITGATLSRNAAGSEGGAVYAISGAVSVTDCAFGGDAEADGNSAGGSGGAIYAGSGNVTVSGGSMKHNSSTGGSGGALYVGTGIVTVSGYTANEVTSYTQFVGNSATEGKGGAVYLDGGTITLTSVTATGNSAINGAAIFTNTGRAIFDAGSYTGNVASEGGAVGVGGIDARLVFSGTVQIRNNTLGAAEGAPESNVYLDQDDESIINAENFNNASEVGVYVPDKFADPTDPSTEYLFKNRGGIGGKFGICANDATTLPGFKNDREGNLSAVVDSITKRIYWSSKLKVEVRYLGSFADNLPSGSNGTKTYGNDNYSPSFNGGAVSLLADELRGKWTTTPSGMTAPVYAMAFLQGSINVDSYLTRLFWKDGAWWYENRAGIQAQLDTSKKVYIYYSEAAFLSIENNTSFPAELDSLTVNLAGQDRSLFNSSTLTGLGLVYALNGSIQEELLPVQLNDAGKIVLARSGGSITILVPGGQNVGYALDGAFNGGSGSIDLRLNGVEQEPLDATEAFQISGTTRNDAKTYEIIFGTDRIICKIACPEPDGISEDDYVKRSDAPDDDGNIEYCFAKMQDAAAFAGKYRLTDVTIEMLVDYLMPGTDTAVIEDPAGHHFETVELKTAVTGQFQYPGTGDKRRATISRGVGNESPLVQVTGNVGASGADTETTFSVHDIDFDGKNLVGKCEGGALATKNCKVEIHDAGFINCNSFNGGAIYISYGTMATSGTNRKYTFPAGYNSTNATFTITNATFENCVAQKEYGRSGGGGIWTNAKIFTATNCSFTNCKSTGDNNMQGGAVFHRIESTDKFGSGSKTPYFAASQTIFTGCTFSGCVAQGSGGAMESDATDVQLYNCTFTNCSTKYKDGAVLNVYIFEQDGNMNYNSIPSRLYMKGCIVIGSTSARNGGAVRSMAVDNEFVDCTFTNTTATGNGKGGGAIYVSNNRSVTTTVTGCTFTGTASNKGPGGAICTYSKELTVSGTTITNCQSKDGLGGGIYHLLTSNVYDGHVNNVNSFTILSNTTINGCTAKTAGGGLHTNAFTVTINEESVISDNTASSQGGGVVVSAAGETALTIADSTISRNTASSNGGGVWFDANSDNNTIRANLTLNVNGSSINGNTSNNGSGGGIYTLAKTVSIGASETRIDSDGNAIPASVSNNTAKNGGGVYQSRNVDGAKLEISDADISGNKASSGVGGGVYAAVRTLNVTSAEISRNSATGDGGGIWFDVGNDTDRAKMELTVEGCTLNTDLSNGNGGGIFTYGKTVAVRAHTEETDAGTVTTVTTISNCTAAKNGGGIYQNRDIDGSSLTISGAAIRNNKANGTGNELGGGGVYANVRDLTLTASEVSGNTAARYGGGIYKNSAGNDRFLIVDSSRVQNNSAGSRGGGIYDRSQLTLRNGAEITGNRLTTNTAEDCAGVYLENNRTLFVGSEGAAIDTVIVRDNTTANGTLSDLRLWEESGQNVGKIVDGEVVVSAYVYCNLSTDSEIRVVNAKKVSTWFGSSAIAAPSGFSDDSAVFKADASTYHGIIDRTDSGKTRIIWAGPPIAKLTDGSGNLLYIWMNNSFYPAIFDRLDTGSAEGSTASPFSLLRSEDLTLYYKYGANGMPYTGTDFCIKMLVENYETPTAISLPYKSGRNVTFTTAQTTDDDYPFTGKPGGRATVTRGSGVGNNKLLTVKSNLAITNIIIDGGTENGIAPNSNTRSLSIEGSNEILVTLGENAVLQNARVSGDGGGVRLDNKNATFEIAGGVLRNCSATNDGGGVYVNTGLLKLTAGSIYQCSATGNGGGVRVKSGVFNMTGGVISGCSANNGGGVYLGGGRSLNMSGGSIINNRATSTGGGVAVWDATSRINLSGKVNISGNTCSASVAVNKACNIELNQDSNLVINTNGGGLYPGSFIGVYVTGEEGTNSFYDNHGVEKKPFGTFAEGDSITNFYSFVNDRNGLKGGLIDNPAPNTIYWIQIFSLQVKKEVVSSASAAVDPDEPFLFKVNIRGQATVSGQLNPAQIDSTTGDYGEMFFVSNGHDTTTAVFMLKDGETVTGVNLSEGLTYEVIEYLTVDQAKRYAAMPMNEYSPTVETVTYNDVAYQVVKANIYTSNIGENKNRTDVDPYTSALTFANLMPVCKITDMNGNLLYRRYDWDKVTNKAGEGPDGGSAANPPYYYAPAVFTELTGADGAFKALEGTLYASNGSNPTSYSVSNGVKIQMLIADYSLTEPVAANRSKVTLTTASSDDARFPKQDAGTTSTIRRAFADGSMFEVSGDLTVAKIILDGVKGSYTVGANGGIANVPMGGKLTIQSGATLQNSRTAAGYNGGAVYVAAGGTVTMTGGTVNHNESVDDGAGIYLAQYGILNLSGDPYFGGTGRNVSGNIITSSGNFKDGALTAEKNGGKSYTKARQDIYIAEAQEDPASVVLTGNLNVADGSIWVWAESENHYVMMKPFATISGGTVNGATYSAFRNARPDNETNCGGDDYLSGSSGSNAAFIYWAGGFDIFFRKIDSLGDPLPGATFTLYTDQACTVAVKRGAADMTAVSADGAKKGDVLFEQVPSGIYYMKETGTPEGYANAQNTYIVLAGDVQGAGTGVLEYITQAQIDKQKGTGDAAIFLIDSASGKAVAAPDAALADMTAAAIAALNIVAPDIASSGILNPSAYERRVILKKVNTTYEPLDGAVFKIFRCDWTTVKGTDINGNENVTTFPSGNSGAYFIDTLPYGKYYLCETTVPSGVTPPNNGGCWWYTLTVDAAGVTCSAQSATIPTT